MHFVQLRVGSVFKFYRQKYTKTAQGEAVAVHRFMPRGGRLYSFRPQAKVSVILKG